MSANDLALRQWTLLRSIPRYPQRASTRELRDRLLQQGFEVTPRSVQRDLATLSTTFGYTSEEEGRTLFWFWPKDFGLLDVPGMEPVTALTFTLAEAHLNQILPASALQLLAPYFKTARGVLGQSSGSRYSRWPERVRVLGRGPGLTVPQVQHKVLAVLEQGLLGERVLRIHYCRRGEAKASVHEISPRALVVKDGIYYLIATYGAQMPPYHFALHRATAAEILDQSSPKLPEFDLDRYIRSVRAFDWPIGRQPISLMLSVTEGVRVHLEERALSSDQRISATDDGRYRVEASVMSTSELRWWLLGYGPEIEVIRPIALRREIAATIAGAHALYRC